MFSSKSQGELPPLKMNPLWVGVAPRHRKVNPLTGGSIKIYAQIQKEEIPFGISSFCYCGGLERAAPVRTLVQKVSGGHFLARGRVPQIPDASGRMWMESECVCDSSHSPCGISAIFAFGENANESLPAYFKQCLQILTPGTVTNAVGV